MKVGAHVSIAGGIYRAPTRAHRAGCECFQIFSRSPRGGKAPELTPPLVERFLKECSQLSLENYYIHVPYYTNLASEDKAIRSASVAVIAEDLRRAEIIGAKCVVLHPGSARDQGKKEGIIKVVEGIREIFSKVNSSPILLIENTAGQGAIIGDNFEELAEIIYRVGYPNLGVCLDTAHLLASGYDIRTHEALHLVIDAFDKTVGIERLNLLHANDSKVGLGERRDRHEHIGKGKIGLEGFKALVSHPLLAGVDVVVETKPGKGGWELNDLSDLKEDIETLKKLMKCTVR